MVKPILLGVCGALATLAVTALVYLAYDTRIKALRGDAAATFLEQQIQKQNNPTQEKR